jgi:branched-chain amino acid aminotransferase
LIKGVFTMKETAYIWKNGSLMDWKDATTHVLTHALHYGTGVFEGVRAYKTPQGPAIFRAPEHYKRLIDSGKIYLMNSPYTDKELIDATKLLIKKNDLDSCYIRPLVYFGYGEMGLTPYNNPVDVIISAWEWGAYLGDDGIKNGIRCKISSWNRIDSRTLPPLAKCTANYANSILAKQEAIECGYDEAILLNINGTVSEGPGENIFVIRHDTLYTTPIADNVLEGITANSIKKIAQDMGIPVVEKSMIRDELFLADEAFFTGTAAEVTPIREIDNRVIGNGKRGPITEKLQTKYFDIVEGKDPKYMDWLTVI